MKMKILLFVLVISIPAYSQSNYDFSKYFDQFGVKGSFLLFDLNAEKYYYNDSSRSSSRYIPASTFKIFNSLTALETGAVSDENEIIPWDSIDRDFPEWNKDHNMRTAFKYSAVWFYQELARRIGEERMRHSIDTASYGNRDISGGIDRFWLDGGLRISSFEQLEFLKKFYKNELPFGNRSMTIVKDIMVFEKGIDYTIRAKTGWGMRLSPGVGWFAGWVEKGGNVYFFVNNVEIVKEKDTEARIGITKEILKDLGIIN
jgi:beta-lactamase class D